jgi:hypothetical protein
MAATYVDSQSPGDADDETSMLLQVPESLVNIAHFQKLMPLSPAKPFSGLQNFRQFDCGFASIPFPSERSADGPLIVPSDICSVEGG